MRLLEPEVVLVNCVLHLLRLLALQRRLCGDNGLKLCDGRLALEHDVCVALPRLALVHKGLQAPAHSLNVHGGDKVPQRQRHSIHHLRPVGKALAHSSQCPSLAITILLILILSASGSAAAVTTAAAAAAGFVFAWQWLSGVGALDNGVCLTHPLHNVQDSTDRSLE